MDIEHENEPNMGFFKAVEDGKEAGKMTYVWSPEGNMVIEHTEVHSEFSGKGVGQKLVEAAIAYVREHKTNIVPVCRFAKAQFDRHADWKDVLAEKK